MADIPFDHTTTALDVATPVESERALAWTATVILVIAMLLALFSAASMKSWAGETLPPTPINAVIRQSAEDWSATTERLGLAAPRERLHALWLSAKAQRFGGPPATPAS